MSEAKPDFMDRIIAGMVLGVILGGLMILWDHPEWVLNFRFGDFAENYEGLIVGMIVVGAVLTIWKIWTSD